MGNIFSNGGMFGKPIPLQGAKPIGAVPLQGAQPVTRPLGVVAPQQGAAAAPTAAPSTKPPPAFGHQPLIPPTNVPMGKPGDCPICH